MPTWCWWCVLACNGVAFVLFGWDKCMARLGRWRVREATLLWATFLFGCAGAWVAMGVFHHKTSKPGFRRLALLWTVVNPVWLALALEFR